MTTFRITPFTSVHTSSQQQHAFTGDSAGPDQLIVDPGAFLITQGFGAVGAVLANTGAWTATITGSIHSQQDTGLVLMGGNSGTSKITVGAEGEVSGYHGGLTAFSTAEITNHGTIAGRPESNSDGISLYGGGNHVVTNTGMIEAGYPVYAATATGDIRVTNSGTMLGRLILGEGDDTLINTGRLGGSGSYNSVGLGGGRNMLTNAGQVEGYANGGDDVDTVRNTGTFGKDVYLYDGNDLFVNSGTVNGQAVSGQVQGTIYMMGGNDTFEGGSFAERLTDGIGSDGVTFAGGNDAYLATTYRYDDENDIPDGTDTVSGGTGTDTYDATGSRSNVWINLDTVTHDLGPFAPDSDVVGAGRAFGDEVGTDRISGFENARGGTGSDVLYGSGAANVLQGSFGNDWLLGYAGNDRLEGGAGVDSLVGGAGRDALLGGSDGDSFRFLARADSGPTAATRDTILDFQDGIDWIELDRIDAKAGTTANEAFRFVGTNVAWGGTAGELRAVWTATGQVVEGDVNGDGAADFSIALRDMSHTIQLTEADFIL